MVTLNPTPQADFGSDSAAPTSAERLIMAVGSINSIDVASSSEDDRAAVLELIDIITDEQRSSLLFALLLERLRTEA